MARVNYATPMKAYDYVVSLLAEAAHGDGVVSRADAKGLTKALNGEGKGTEALAAGNVYKLADARDAKPGSRVTEKDLDQTRGYVAKEMLRDYDTNRNGYSSDEIERMSPTAKALIALGRALSIPKRSGRIAKRVPQKGMEHIAALINQAGGADGITSRADRDALVKSLYRQGRGTEALAVAYFFNFTDHRDYKPGARVTVTDIARAVEYSGTSLLANKDGNNNGYSAEEYAKFSTTAKAFTQVGRLIEAGIVKSAA